jgi:hypothetical protein
MKMKTADVSEWLSLAGFLLSAIFILAVIAK